MNTKVWAIVAALALLVGAGVLVVVLTGDDGKTAVAGEPTSSGSTPTDGPTAQPAPDDVDPDDPAYAAAESEPLEDSLYPNVGDPGVDALHYDLDIAWDAESETLTGTTTLAFRATADAPEFQLDLGEPLEVESVTLDGEEVDAQHNGKDLVVERAGQGGPEVRPRRGSTPAPPSPRRRRPRAATSPPPAGPSTTTARCGRCRSRTAPTRGTRSTTSPPTRRSTTSRSPRPATGSASPTAQLQSQETVDGNTVTEWSLDAPASSYLATIAIGDMVKTEDESEQRRPADLLDAARRHRLAGGGASARPRRWTWNEKRLGKYPFESLGILVVESESGMETQTMITLGDTDYTTSPEVLVHEITHQWYGDLVSPTDWKDVWMNEGMTMYLQGQYEADSSGTGHRRHDGRVGRCESGDACRGPARPATTTRPRSAQGNIYYGPALMWHELRKRIGDKAFWAMVKEWPAGQRPGQRHP